MKYTTKSGLELPPKVVEVIEQRRVHHEGNGTWNLYWSEIKQPLLSALQKIWNDDDFTEFYALYPKKDLDSYGNQIVKGEMVQVADYAFRLQYSTPCEFIGIAEKATCKYIVYVGEFHAATSYKYCRKIQVISATEVKKSELQSQMEELKAQVKEIEAKINEL